ncbi:MAG TPA: hypothetical protein VFT59_02085 [Candidatus Saccharimonadales bacterium]|nr:hypothetical protein [Candidatus Saccharimonadales bacterium]
MLFYLSCSISKSHDTRKEVGVIRRRNPITTLLSGRVTIQTLASETGLSISTCRKVLRDPFMRVHEETVAIIRQWVTRNLGEYSLEELFHPDNLVGTGRRPLAG